MPLPNIPIPGQARKAILNRLVWDYLRKDDVLSFNEANEVKQEAIRMVDDLLDGIIERKKSERQ